MERPGDMLFSRAVRFLQDDPTSLAPTAPAWAPEALVWIGIGLLFLVAAGVAAAWLVYHRLGVLERQGRRLATLDELKVLLTRLVADRDDLDLRRIEHVLIDVRDAHKRLEDALLRSVEASQRAPDAPGSLPVPLGEAGLAERATNRLLALGYERIQIVTRADKLTEIASRDGEILVEARREGVLHKGRVLVRSGRIADVEVHPAYSIFP